MTQSTPKILVIGSFITDLSFRVPHRPKRGETIIGTDFGIFTGGKGYNQATAARRMGADVAMIGCLGKDFFSDLFLSSLQKDGIDHSRVIQDESIGTGVASPVIYDSENDNSIIIVPRANNSLLPHHLDQFEDFISKMDLIMLQLEIPLETCIRAAEIGKKHNIPILLNPAPARSLPKSFLQMVDIIIPNEVEVSQLTGINVDDLESLQKAGSRLMELGPKLVIITLGERGAFLMDSERGLLEKSFTVNVVDPTAAGDAFCGGFATILMSGVTTQEALRYGNACGALATTVLGAEPSLPNRDAVETFLFINNSR